MAEISPTPQQWTVGQIIRTTSDFLAQKKVGTPRLDAELLLGHVLKMSKVQLYVNFERILTATELDSYRTLIRRRSIHEPVAYILNRKEFYGLDLKTTKAALIPRPETEHLVDEALRLAKELGPNGEVSIADIGCGTGAIILALAKHLPLAKLWAVDISPDALALAQENARTLGFSEISFHQGNLLEPLGGLDFHLICANLPYIPTDSMATLMPDVGLYEPHLALDGGPQG
ncbi:MAG: peptide chain release factor N(5)-glutamine methyltransferase, partial [Candidatus Adiutrix sp.]